MDTDLPGDVRLTVPALPKLTDLAHDVDGALHPAGNILDQAHDQAFVLGRLDHNGRDLRLPEHLKGLEAALPAYQVVPGAAGPLAPAYGNGALKADCLDVVHDLPVLPLVSRTRVEHGDPGYRDHFDLLGT
jgi:hypothetical protein